MLPPDVSSFLTTPLSLDMEYQSISNTQDNFFLPFTCLNLACQTSVLSHSPRHKQASKTPIVCHSTKPPELPPLPSKDINTKPQSNDSHPPNSFTPLSIGRYEFIEEQRKDKWLNLIVEYITNECQLSTLKDLSKQQKLWIINIAKRCKVIDGLLTYRDEFMIDHDNYRIFVPDNLVLRRQLLKAYHNSTLSMHHGREATFAAISRNFYWRNLSKDVRNWVKRCPDCIKFKTSSQRPGPMNVRLYLHSFHTLGIDLVRELSVSVNGNKFILTAVCPFSNFLISIPIPDKTASTCARALFDHVFLRYGFPSVLQSDRGGEFLNSILHRITKLLQVKHVFTTLYRPRLNGAAEYIAG